MKNVFKKVTVLLVSVLLLSIMSTTSLASTYSINVTCTRSHTLARQLKDKINEARRSKGLPALTYDYALEEIGMQRAEGLEFHAYYSQEMKDLAKWKVGGIISNREAQGHGMTTVDNACKYFIDYEDVMGTDYSYIGVGEVKIGELDVWTVELGNKASQNYQAPSETNNSYTVKWEFNDDEATIHAYVRNKFLVLGIGQEMKLSPDELYREFRLANYTGTGMAVILPSSSFSFSYRTDDSSIAKVENNTLKGVAKGNTVLRVKITLYNGFSKELGLTVNIKETPVTPTPKPTVKPTVTTKPSVTAKPAATVTAKPTVKATATPTAIPTMTFAEPTRKAPTKYEDDDADSDILEFVERIYRFVLDREPEEDGVKYWSDELYSFRRNGAEVAQGFIFSDEFEKRGTTDTEFIEILYRTFFGREADAAGLNYWLSKLFTNEMSRRDVANGFIYSQEWADTCAEYGIRSGGNIEPNVEIKPTDATYAFVERMYTTAMGRGYDEGGRQYWAVLLSNFKVTGEEVGASFFLSDEITGYRLSDREYLNRLYKTFMDRDPDNDGYNYWLGFMKDHSRTDVVYGFTRSPEFTQKCIDARILPF